MSENKSNKTCMINVRCTVNEKKQFEKQAAKKGMNLSKYIRMLPSMSGREKKNDAQIVVKVQEFLNHLEETGKLEGKTEERMADEIWELLLK